jgi:hypothetical protein
MRQKFEVIVLNKLPDFAPELIIQWHRDNYHYLVTTDPYTESNNLYKDTTVMMIELGWFTRHRNLLLYDKNDLRFKPMLNKNYAEFFKPIKESKNKVWLIMGQMPNDRNINSCDNYEKWIENVTSMLKLYGNYPVYYRPHPKGEIEPENELDIDLGRAIGVVSWNSSGVLKAMMHSIPVCIYDFPEIEDVCQKELTREWIIEVEREKHRVLHANKLNWLASQQINIDEFQTLNYEGYL